MFDPIVAPDVHRGPAVGHSTEFGTTWQEAVTRINAAFKAIFEGAGSPELDNISDAVSGALFKLDAIEKRIDALETKYGKLVVVPKAHP